MLLFRMEKESVLSKMMKQKTLFLPNNHLYPYCFPTNSRGTKKEKESLLPTAEIKELYTNLVSLFVYKSR